MNKEVPGLDTIPREFWPNVPVVFQTYHLMIIMWTFMVVLTILGWWHWKRGTLAKKKALLWAMILSVLCPHIAQQSGWITAEVGRQPWVVWNQLRTADAVSTNINSAQVIGSIVMFSLIYALLFSLFIFLLDRKIKHGPEDEHPGEQVYRSPFGGSDL